MTVDVVELDLPNGARATIEIVNHPGGAAVAAVDEERRVCLLRHYRPVFGDWFWELPAGKRDHGEDPQETARRELAEETGVTATGWRPLGEVIPSPGVFGEVIYLFLAQDLTCAAAAPDADELFETHWIALDDALNMAAAGEIDDAKTVTGLLRAQHRLAFAQG